jgi:hypothetical protein
VITRVARELGIGTESLLCRVERDPAQHFVLEGRKERLGGGER